MKRLLLILFIIPFIGFGQTETKREYYTSGKLLSIIDYKDGIEILKSYDRDLNLLPMGEGC